MTTRFTPVLAGLTLTLLAGFITLNAFESNGVDAESKAEVAAILESLRAAVMGKTES